MNNHEKDQRQLICLYLDPLIEQPYDFLIALLNQNCMSHPRPSTSDLLPLLAVAFPRTFFADPKQVQPLKINIHHDLKALRQAHALPAELEPLPLKRLLRWYTRQTCYLQALARGAGRIDLTGAVVDTDFPPHIRQQAQQEVERRRPRPAARGESRSPGAAALLLTLAAAFPQTFFPEPAQVQPLKAFLYRDLLRLAEAGALPSRPRPNSAQSLPALV